MDIFINSQLKMGKVIDDDDDVKFIAGWSGKL